LAGQALPGSINGAMVDGRVTGIKLNNLNSYYWCANQ
jgi:hypothetical protein